MGKLSKDQVNVDLFDRVKELEKREGIMRKALAVAIYAIQHDYSTYCRQTRNKVIEICNILGIENGISFDSKKDRFLTVDEIFEAIKQGEGIK